jgi:hypothetical protein
MSQEDYCTYLINKINECDAELHAIAKSNMPIANVYYEKYLIMSRKNYVQRLAANCNSHISPKYFRKYQPCNKLDTGVPRNSRPHNPFGNRDVLNTSLEGGLELRPFAKPFYPNTVDTGIETQCNPIPTNLPASIPPPLEDCDDLPIDYQKSTWHSFVDYLLFNDTKCCHGIYCPGYRGFYECPFEKT